MDLEVQVRQWARGLGGIAWMQSNQIGWMQLALDPRTGLAAIRFRSDSTMGGFEFSASHCRLGALHGNEKPEDWCW